jgi:TP901 family phage tail tape measure protein
MAGDNSADVVAKISGDDKELQRDLAKTKRATDKHATDSARSFKRAWSSAFGTFAGLLGLDGLQSLMGAGRQVLDFQKRLTRLGISGRASAADMIKLEKTIWSAADAMGLEHEQLLAGAEAYTEKTGHLEDYTAALKDYAAVAAATGADSADTARIGAALSTNLGIQADQMGKVFDVLVYGGQQGAVELRNMAGLFAELTPQVSLFAAKGVDAASDLSGLLQLTATGFSTAEEAGTGLRALMDALIRRSKDIKRLGGVDVFTTGKDGSKHLRDLSDIIFEIGNSKLMKDPQKLQKALGGRGEAFRAVLAITQKVNGKTAKERFGELTDEAAAAGTVAKDAAQWAQSAAGQMASAQERLAQFFNDTMKDKIGAIADGLKIIAAILQVAADHAVLFVSILAGSKIAGAINMLERATAGMNAAAAAGGAGGAGGVPVPGGGATATQVIAAGFAYEGGHKLGEGINWLTDQLTGETLSEHISDAAGAGGGQADYMMNRGEAGPGAPTYRDFLYGRNRGKTMDQALDARERAAELEKGIPGLLSADDQKARAEADLAPEGTGAYMDKYLATRDQKEAELRRRVQVYRDDASRLMFQSQDEKGLSAKKRMRSQVEGKMALDAAISNVPGATQFLNDNPEALGTLVTDARRLAGQNPGLGMAAQTGSTELLTSAIKELTIELRKMKGPDTGPHPIPLDDGGGARQRRSGR